MYRISSVKNMCFRESISGITDILYLLFYIGLKTVSTLLAEFFLDVIRQFCDIINCFPG